MSRAYAPAVRLDVDEIPARRCFASPDHIAADRAVLCMLTRDFSRHLAAATTGRPVVRYVPELDDWHRRVVIPEPNAFSEDAVVTVVGFFGRVRDVVDPLVAKRIKALSEQLVEAVMCTPGVLGYTTHMLADEKNYANLVLVSSPDIIEQWRSTAPHPVAAGDWSTRYYQHLRIYRGSVRMSELGSEGSVSLESVKYWDYGCDPVWHAIRTLA